ncbi:hypothetical protein N7478_001978 [Penicillium angulare]|uniref:uncharacterized protein n=1 Tax=Penicillium angulare TaxID=116970 RepID=UPI0025407CB8|nr:uncharacterized protein N7478_001978 [Penicillium angulare]KAJ5288948.1 hypothetical protein N7478_001978 [Penicillium angulare]
MNWISEARKKGMVEKRERREKAMTQYPDLDWDVIGRISQLGIIRNLLNKKSDADDRENVEAVIKAYKEQTLKWHPHLVTYWANGEQICKPRPFDWDEFDLIHDHYNGHIAFWIEPMDLHLRLDSNHPPMKFEFVDDTGAEMMSIFEDDVNNLRLWSRRQGQRGLPQGPRNCGYVVARHADGSSESVPVVAIRPNILAGDPPRWLVGAAFPREWPRVPCIVRPASQRQRGASRLLGP